MADVTQILIDIADALLMGIPSNIFMGDISHKYNVEIADLQRTYDMLSQAYNEDVDIRNALQNKQYEILNVLSTTSPLGAWRTELKRKYDSIGKRVDSITSDIREKGQRLTETSTALTKKQLEAGSSTLGSEASKYFFGGK